MAESLDHCLWSFNDLGPLQCAAKIAAEQWLQHISCGLRCTGHLLLQAAKPCDQWLRLLSAAAHWRNASSRHDIPPQAPACRPRRNSPT